MTAPIHIGSSLWNGHTIGLLGGSFNPAHKAHGYIAEQALKRLGLDFVWLLVSPGNPLKGDKDMASHAERMKTTDFITRHPNIVASDIECSLGTNRTFDTIMKLKNAFPRSNFIWLMGADNMQQFEQWYKWDKIACTLPIAIFDRPEYSIARLTSGLARKFRKNQVPNTLIYKAKAPAWTFVTSKRNKISATAIRGTTGRH
jgi:nicotinate-nucleotide adenylyltransferase